MIADVRVRRPARHSVALLAAALLLVAATRCARAGEIVIEVTGVRSDTGEVGCALFSSPNGFPLDTARAVVQWQPARRNGMTCQFADVKPGRYAVAVSQDLKGDHRTHTNFLGIPTDDWGVSNGVRPTLRAPRFDEAAIAVADTPPTKINIRIAP